MTGTFNSTEQAEIAGQSTAPIGGTVTASAASKTGSTGTSTAVGSSASTTPAATSTATGSANGAGKPVIATGFVGLVAALVGASFL